MAKILSADREVGPSQVATDGAQSGPMNARIFAGVRVTAGVLWLTNAGWKTPPDFSSLFNFTKGAVDHPILPPYSWLVEHQILPHIGIFGWMVLLTEAMLGAFLILGLATRFWALVGAAQAIAIGLSVALLPGEWPWSYYLMVLVHLAIFASAAGRTWGLDELLRPVLPLEDSRIRRLLLRAT
jgi:thiosulfate dehydrogenase [quinone] large subunit